MEFELNRLVKRQEYNYDLVEYIFIVGKRVGLK
jgi:hypothetical protein